VHWVIYNITASLDHLEQGIRKEPHVAGIGMQGGNDFGKIGYDGPCPPAGKPHRYYFTFYALDYPPTLAAGLKKVALLNAISGHILRQAQWMGTYQTR